MFHNRRIWTLADVDSPCELAEKLTQQTLVLCQGFRWHGLLLLNDSLSEDGAQEHAVVDEGPLDSNSIRSRCRG